MKEKSQILKNYSIENLDKRLNDVMDYLLKKDPINYKSQTKVSKAIKFPQSNLSAALNGKEIYLTENIIDKFCSTFPELSKSWLLTGEGSMLNKLNISNEEFLSHLPDPEPRITEADVYKKLEELKKKKSKSSTEPSSRIVNDDDLIDAIEYRVPWKGQAGLASKFYPDEMIEQLSRNVIRVKPEYKGVYFTIEVDGNSMPPQIQPGDWLRCEEISSLFWLEKNFFKKDKIYCIWHNSRGIIFKRLIYKNSGEIWCSSDNEDKLEFPDFPLEIEKVNKILVVRSLVDRKF